MKRSNIKYTQDPDISDIEFLTKHINEETPHYGKATPFGFFIQDDAAHIIAGANGFLMYGTIYTDQLWVDKAHRGQGLGKELMDAVHALGKQSECKIASVQTMSFQNAQAFYEKLGYVADFKRRGYVQESCCIFMKKNL